MYKQHNIAMSSRKAGGPLGAARRSVLLGLVTKRLEQVLSLIGQAVHVLGSSVIYEFECHQVGDNQCTGPGVIDRSGADTEVVFGCFIVVSGLDQRTRYGLNLHYKIVQVIIHRVLIVKIHRRWNYRLLRNRTVQYADTGRRPLEKLFFRDPSCRFCLDPWNLF